MRSFRMATLLVWFSLLTPNSSFAADEDPAIEVAVSAAEIFIGETIDLQVEIRNVENP